MWQMRFNFQHSQNCGPHTSSIGVVVLGYHWSKKSSTVENFIEASTNLKLAEISVLDDNGDSILREMDVL